ncbi:hypothetical protein D3C71_1131760 [compost metagenome]
MDHHIPVQTHTGLFGERRIVVVHPLLHSRDNRPFTVFHRILLSFNSPVVQDLSFFRCQKIKELDSPYRVLTLAGDRDPIPTVKAGGPEAGIFILLAHCDWIVTISLIEFAGRFQRILSISIVPFRVCQTEDSARGHFRLELIRLLHEAFRVKQTLRVHVVQPAEIFSFFWTAEMVSGLVCILINVIFPVIRSPGRQECRVRHLIHMPIVRIQGQADIFVPILICRMLGDIILNHFFVILYRANLRVSRILDNTVLKLESLVSFDLLLIDGGPGRDHIDGWIIQTVLCPYNLVPQHFLNVWCILVD